MNITSDHLTVLQIIGACALIAALPAGVWGYVFFRKQQEDRFHVRLTFVVGALAVFPILFYRFLWQFFPWMNVFEWTKQYEKVTFGLENFFIIPVSVILTFMIVGVIEEIMKQSTVHVVDDGKLRNIDDAIEFSIIAALGFSFAENIIYFYNIWIQKGPESLLLPFVFRSIFSTFAHVLFSGVFGYFYGIAQFADPILQKQLRDKRNRFTRFMHRIFRSKTDELFHEEKMLEGLLLAVGLHAVYDVFLEMNWTFLMVPYLVFGYLLLSHLLALKENRKAYGFLLVGERNNDNGVRKITGFVHETILKRLK